MIPWTHDRLTWMSGWRSLLAIACLSSSIADKVEGPVCWTGSFSRGLCCNEIFGVGGNSFCWDADTFNFESCCQGRLYKAPNCEDFVTHFSFASLRYRGDSMERCAEAMEQDPLRCNSPNATLKSCPACGSISPHLLTYIRCVRLEQEQLGAPLDVAALPRVLRQHRYRRHALDGVGGGPAHVGGYDFPTVLRPRSRGRDFTIVAPAFDAYVGDALLHEGSWMLQEVQLLERLLPPGGVVVDAGANIGGFALPFARRVGPDGEVHAFEPFRLLFQLLTANCALNGLRSCITHHMGLGSVRQRKDLRMPGLNAIGNPSKMFVADSVSSERHIHYDGRHREVVEVMPLDELKLKRLDLLKIDVESMELEVLIGAKNTIRQHRPAIFVEDSEGDQEAPTKVMRLLEEQHSYGCIKLPEMTSLLCASTSELAEIQRRLKADGLR